MIKLIFYLCVWYGSTNAALHFELKQNAYICIQRQSVLGDSYLIGCMPLRKGKYVYRTPGPIGPIDGNYRPHSGDTYHISIPLDNVHASQKLHTRIYMPGVSK